MSKYGYTGTSFLFTLAYYWLPVVLYCAGIFILSAYPVSIEVSDFPYMDKWAHLIEYAILAIFCTRALTNSKQGRQRVKMLLISITFSVLYGISDEIHQMFVPSRTPDMGDVLFDAIGAFLGAGLYQAIASRFPTFGKI